MEFEVDCVLLSVGLIPENELSLGAGIEMDLGTKGPVVYDNMETSIPGIFASGNVVHVHDLVDFVSAEGEKAGEAAGKYVAQGALDCLKIIHTQALEKVAYTVPQRIRYHQIDKGVQLFFRVRQVMKDATIVVKDKDNVIAQFKREHMAPGEMETIMIP